MYHYRYVPIAIYFLFAFILLCRPYGLIRSALAASFCGIILLSFTGGPSGGIWMAQVFVLIAMVARLGSYSSVWETLPKPARWLMVVFFVYFVGIIVGTIAYDPVIEVVTFNDAARSIGIPLRFGLAAYRFLVLMTFVGAFLLPLTYRVDNELVVSIHRVVWFFGVVLGIASLLGYFGIADLSFSIRSEIGYQRASFMGFHRAPAGLMLVTAIFFTWAFKPKKQFLFGNVIFLVGMAIMAGGLLTTWSRAGVLCLIVGGLIAVVLDRAFRKFSILVAISLLAIAMISLLYLVPELAERFSISGATSAGRTQGWLELIQWMTDHPLSLITGVGFFNFHYSLNLTAGVVTLEAAHNMYLHMLTEQGIIGLLIFLVWCLSTLVWLWKWHRDCVRHGRRSHAGILLGLFVGILVSGITQESLVAAPGMTAFHLFFFLIYGVIVGYAIHERAVHEGMPEYSQRLYGDV